jgi:large subunit ribosomal protein L6
MKKELYKKITLPSGVEISLKHNEIKVKGPEGEILKEINFANLDVSVSNGVFKIGHKVASKKEKRLINTLYAHIKNMIEGVQKKFEYTLKVASSHFPMTVKVEGNNAIIKNYYGEKTDRKTQIPKGVEVQVNKDIITVKSVDKELAGQVAANFENVTKVRNRDRRIFQDGVYIINKSGKEM